MRLGLDVGGTKIHAVAVADDNEIVDEVRLSTLPGDANVVSALASAIKQLMHVGVPTSIGIGIPGQIQPGTTRVKHAVNLGITDLDLGAALAPFTPATVRVTNDVKAATLGAHTLRGGGDMAFLNIGTGVAAGLVIGGTVLSGATGLAGEIGHMSIDPAGPPCRCGQRGCVEALCGGGSLAERWGGESNLPVRDVFDAADAGDPFARALRGDVARGIEGAIMMLTLTADVDAVVVGGGVTMLGERLFDDVRALFAERGRASAFASSLRLDERMEPLPAGSPAAALGAALIGVASLEEGALAHG